MHLSMVVTVTFNYFFAHFDVACPVSSNARCRPVAGKKHKSTWSCKQHLVKQISSSTRTEYRAAGSSHLSVGASPLNTCSSGTLQLLWSVAERLRSLHADGAFLETFYFCSPSQTNKKALQLTAGRGKGFGVVDKSDCRFPLFLYEDFIASRLMCYEASFQCYNLINL